MKINSAQLEKLVEQRLKIALIKLTEAKKTTKPVAKLPIKKVSTKKITEDIAAIRLPSSIQTYMTKIGSALSKINLNKNQKMAAIYQLANDLGVSHTEFSGFASKIKSEI